MCALKWQSASKLYLAITHIYFIFTLQVAAVGQLSWIYVCLLILGLKLKELPLFGMCHSYGNKWKHETGLSHSVKLKSLLRHSGYRVIFCWSVQVTRPNLWQGGMLCLQGGNMSHMLMSRDIDLLIGKRAKFGNNSPWMYNQFGSNLCNSVFGTCELWFLFLYPGYSDFQSLLQFPSGIS